MKSIKFIASSIVVLLLISTFLAGVVNAQSDKSVVGKPTINKSVYVAGSSVYVSGDINGDVYCAGQNVDINATVHGDVICVGQDVNVSGQVYGSVRIAAQNATVDANVSRSVSLAAETASLGFKSVVGQDFSAWGQTVNISGNVARDVTVSSSSLTLNGLVGRNMQYNGSNLTLDNRASVAGSLSYTSPQTAYLVNGSKINGHIYYTQRTKQNSTFRQVLRAEVTSFLFVALSILLLALLFVLVIPKTINKLSENISSHLGKTILIGFAATIAIPIVTFILFITAIGIPLAIFLLMSWAFLWMLSFIVSGFYLGKLVMPGNRNAILAVTMGEILLIALIFIPVIGFFVGLVSYFAGAGAILMAVRKQIPNPDYKLK